MAVEFMVAVKPNAKNLDAELEALKAAVLYADKVSVLSPSFDVYHTLTLKSKNKKNIEIDIINRLLKAVPVCEFVSEDDLTEEHGQLLELQRVSKTPQYRNSSLVERLKIQAILKESQKGTIEDLEDIFGKEKMDEFESIDKVRVEPFKTVVSEAKDFYNEYMEKLDKNINKNIMLLDEKVGEECFSLPIFPEMSFKEILDLREELLEEIRDFNKDIDELKKEMENNARKKIEYDFKELAEKHLKEDYDILVKALEEKNLKSDKNIVMVESTKEDIINLFNEGLMKEIIEKSTAVEENTEYDKYELKKGNEKAEISFLIK